MVHAQMLEGKWYKGRVISVEKELMPDGSLETDPVLLKVFVFFDMPTPNGCNGFDYRANLVADTDGDDVFELIDQGVFSTCGNNEKGAVAGFEFNDLGNDGVAVYFNGKLIKGKKFVSQGCVILIDTPTDLTGQGFPEVITRNCKILLKLTKCDKLPFDPQTLNPPLPPCP
jgi:hypothetical protein